MGVIDGDRDGDVVYVVDAVAVRVGDIDGD